MGNMAYDISFRSIGEDVFIYDRSKILSPEVISIGDSVIIDDFVFVMGGKETTLGSFIHIAQFSSLVGGGTLVMEDFSGISAGTRVFTGNDDYLGSCLTNPTVPEPYRKAIRGFIRIKKHAIIGAGSVILPNVTIGEGAVVGANSLVKADCEPWTVYVGSPAKPVKERPRAKILELEKALRSELYDENNKYVPQRLRKPASDG